MPSHRQTQWGPATSTHHQQAVCSARSWTRYASNDLPTFVQWCSLEACLSSSPSVTAEGHHNTDVTVERCKEHGGKEGWDRAGTDKGEWSVPTYWEKTRGEVQCVDPHRHGQDRPSTQEHCPDLMKQWALSLLYRLALMLHTTTSSWFPRTATNMLYLGWEGNVLLHKLVIYRKYTTALPPPPKPSLPASVSSVWKKKNQCASHPLPCSCVALSLSLCLSLCLSLMLLCLILFSLL